MKGNLRGCVSQPLFPEVRNVLTRETLKADPGALGRLMADHTQVRGGMTDAIRCIFVLSSASAQRQG